MKRLSWKKRCAMIAAIIEAVDHRAMAADGPVTPTLEEMTQPEMSRIYVLATGESVAAYALTVTTASTTKGRAQ